MESVTALRINYHIHFAMKWFGVALTFACMGLVFHDYVPWRHVAIVNALAAMVWTLRMDKYVTEFRRRYRDEREKLAYRVWGDY